VLEEERVPAMWFDGPLRECRVYRGVRQQL